MISSNVRKYSVSELAKRNVLIEYTRNSHLWQKCDEPFISTLDKLKKMLNVKSTKMNIILRFKKMFKTIRYF